MKKFVCMMIVFALTITTVTALAEFVAYTDRDGDFTFTYDTDVFEVTFEDYQSDDDDNLVLVLSGKVETWGNVFIQFTRVEFDEEDLYTMQEAEQELINNTGATKGEWNGFYDVLMYGIDDEECIEQTYVITCSDDETLSILIHVDKIEDELSAKERDDQISAVVDTVVFLDQDDD